MRSNPATVVVIKHRKGHRTASTAAETALRIIAMAEARHGVVTREELLAVGLTRRAIANRLASGRLHRVHRGVYAVGRPSLTTRGTMLAATLAYGPTAVLSHRSAGWLSGLLPTPGGRPELTVPGSGRRGRRGIRLHRTRWLGDERGWIDGIPVTSLARTLLDLAGVLSAAQLLRVVEQADRAGVLNLAVLLAELERSRGRRGTAELARSWTSTSGRRRSASELERRFPELVVSAGLPRPLINSQVAGLEVDFYWPQWRLVVELDGRAFHSGPQRYEGDRTRTRGFSERAAGCCGSPISASAGPPAEVLDDIAALAALAASSRDGPTER